MAVPLVAVFVASGSTDLVSVWVSILGGLDDGIPSGILPKLRYARFRAQIIIMTSELGNRHPISKRLRTFCGSIARRPHQL